MFESNEILDTLPKHLMDLVIDQPYNEYTPQDHAVWRYVMRRNVKYLSQVAHESYVDGLKKTGVSIDSIPHMYGMNRILKEIGWAAVTVDGFIPPAAFMEFQAYKVLVIAADIRPINQINYTPAPDIIHEAAGHAPIIANEEYAEYLRFFGEIGHKAFSSKKDYEIYEAIRYLSILKADPYTTIKDVEKAERQLAILEENLGEPSEMSLIRNLHWWTVEYGLIGTLKNPKIYGAGLLSSIGESMSCLKDDVQKLPYTIEASQVDFDITTKQPQLFVTPDFKQLTYVLEEFADSMALRKGGLYGVEQATKSGATATLVWSSGLQVSGTFTNVISKEGNPVFVKTTGPTTLNINNKQIKGHGKSYHNHGFSSSVGKLRGCIKPLELFDKNDLNENNIIVGKKTILVFESGLQVEGKLENVLSHEHRKVLLTFSDCTVNYEGQVLFEPSWGIYDMAVGSEIISAYTGPADADAFGLKYPVPKEKTHKIIHTEKAKNLHKLYKQVREIRESKNTLPDIQKLFRNVQTKFPNDWLLPLEIYELAKDLGADEDFLKDIVYHMERLKHRDEEISDLINNGLELI